ncbi:hypothetical protein [Klebsiella quasipneumoniae]|uniref:hypothetical protein n=1 Tax=Klebsiella quasipneumoniae TaxID=1463165 RepID=UPI002206DEBD|nr:hypothetical protein [Klebsiella quasipneumoniae]BDO05712.1 hypothetical protein KAM622c_52990 [Klebsiella quasipneumoniae subsp. quasipneumoniae]
MKLNELNTFVIDVHLARRFDDPATARRFECVKEMVRKQGFNAILSEITAAAISGIFIEYKLKAIKPLLSTD